MDLMSSFQLRSGGEELLLGLGFIFKIKMEESGASFH